MSGEKFSMCEKLVEVAYELYVERQKEEGRGYSREDFSKRVLKYLEEASSE